MLANLKLALKNSIIFSLGPLSAKLAGFILIPLYTSQFNTAEFGVLGLIEVSMQAVISVFSLGLYWAFNRWYWDKEYQDKQKSMFFTILIFLFFTSIFIFLLFKPFSSNVSFFLFESEKYSYLLLLMIIVAGFQIFTNIPATLLKLQQKPVLFSIANIVRLASSLSLTVYFITVLGKGLEGIYEALFISNLLYLLFLSKYIWNNIQFKFEVKLLKEMLHFSIPLVIASIATILFSFADRYILKFMDGLSNVGIYSLSFKLSNTIKVFLIQSVILAISPMIYKMMDSPGNKRFYSKIMTYFSFGIIFFVILLSSFGRELVIFIARSEDYWDAYKLIPILSFSMFFIALKSVADIGLNIMKLTKIHSVNAIIIAVLNIILNFVLINFYQEIGASIAHLLSQLIYFILTYYFAQKYYPIPYEIKKIVKLFSLAVLIVILSVFSWELSTILSVTIRISLIAIFPILLYYLNFYEEIEIIMLKEFANKIFKKNINDSTL